MAHIIGLSVASVRRWRLCSKGPKYLKIGAAVRYRTEDVRAWLETRPAVANFRCTGGNPNDPQTEDSPLLTASELKRRTPDVAKAASDLYRIEFRNGVARCPFPNKHTHGDRDPSLRHDKKRIGCSAPASTVSAKRVPTQSASFK